MKTQKGNFSFKKFLFIILLAAIALLVIGFGVYRSERNSPKDIKPTLAMATVVKPKQTLSDFTLASTQGNFFSLTTLKGHWSLLFFGYSDCPDICPRTLSQIADAYQLLETQTLPTPRFIFISLNPEQDSTDKLKSFLGRFNPNFIGLTGNNDEMEKLASACRIYRWTDPNLNSQGQKVIDHSATLLLINPKGQIQAILSPPYQSSEIAKDLQILTKIDD